MTVSASPNIALIGLESVGKSALFRHLTGESIGDESNVRGSTVRVRRASLLDQRATLIDTPGIRTLEDSLTTRLALQQVDEADIVLLVARGTHLQQEINTLLHQVGDELQHHRTALVVTFSDRASTQLVQAAQQMSEWYGIPTALVNARQMSHQQGQQINHAISNAQPLRLHQRQPIELEFDLPVVQPTQTLFERRWLGPWLAILSMVLLYVVPVYTAYKFAEWAQPRVEMAIITPLRTGLTPLERSTPVIHAVLVGSYGLLTLGWYSFLWSFPVVVLIGISTALADETGLKDRITAALDPWLRSIGLHGRDLAPVLTGFGCNVVAVFQSRACSSCTRKSCVSLITFGSACSYQIGASLSLFNSADAPWLFAPYLLILTLVAAIHTRLWHGSLEHNTPVLLAERAFLQPPTWRGIWWRIRAVLQQFLYEAMPIFFVICMIGALLEYWGGLALLATWVAPLLTMLSLPGEVAPALIFSIIRKDGLLALNQGDGALLATLSLGQVFVLVYLASTLTACLVTLWTVRKELGIRYALRVAGRQALTSLVSTWSFSWLIA